MKEFKDSEGRWLIAVINIHGAVYAIATYYGPNEDKTNCLETFLDKIDELDTPNIVIGGDFNFVFDSSLDKMGGNYSTNFKCRGRTIRWMAQNNITDIWRARNPTTRKYTWVSNTKPPIICRLKDGWKDG